MNTFDILEKFLTKHKISGIFFVPNYGSATIFKNDLDKLVVLDHAKLEIDVEEKKRSNEVTTRVLNETSKNINKIPNYIR